MAVFAPMPSASVSTATVVKPGCFISMRRAFRLTDVAIGKGNFEVLRDRQIVEQMELLENKSNVALVEFAALFGVEPMDGLVEEIILPLPGAVIHPKDTEQK